MPVLAPGPTLPKTFYQDANIPGITRGGMNINGQVGTVGNSNCFYLDAFADLDIFGGPSLGFINFYADFVYDGVRIEIPQSPAESGISGAGKENPTNIDNQIIKDGVFIGAGFFVYNDDPDPGLGNYGFSGLVYNGSDFTTETSVASDQTFFDLATEFGNNNTSTIINRDDLDTFYFATTTGAVSVSLTTGAYNEIALTGDNIKQFLFCNDDICFYQGADNSIYDLDGEEYVFTDLEMYSSFPSVSLLFDGTYFYLINNDNGFPNNVIYRFEINGDTYNPIELDDAYLFGVNSEGRIVGGLAA